MIKDGCKINMNLFNIVLILSVAIVINAAMPYCLRTSAFYYDLLNNYAITKENTIVYLKDYHIVINSNDIQHTLKLYIRHNDQEIPLDIFVNVLKEYFKFQFAITNNISNLFQHQLVDLKCNQNKSFHGTYSIVNGSFNVNPHLMTKQGCKISNASGSLEVETVTIILIKDSFVVDEKYYINKIVKELFQLNNLTFDHFFLRTSFCMYNQVKDHVKNEQDKVLKRIKGLRIFLLILVITVAVVLLKCSSKFICNNRVVSIDNMNM